MKSHRLNKVFIEFQETIMTLNPHGRKGVLLLKEHYDLMRDFIISAFESENDLSFTDLMDKVSHTDFIKPVESALWHLLKVKQDLQARGIIKIRFVGTSSRVQVLKLNRRALKNLTLYY